MRYLNNFIDKNFQYMFLPLYILMSLLCIPKYTCDDGFVTPISRSLKLKSLLINLSLLIVTYFRFATSFVFTHFNPSVIGIATAYIDLVYYSTAFSLFCIGSILNSENNVNFILNLQKACRNYRFIKMDFKHLTLCNWAAVIAIPVYYMFFIISYNGDVLGIVLNFVPLTYFDVSVVYIIRLTWIIHDGLRTWIEELQRYCNQHVPNGIVRQGHKMLESYCYILDAFSLLKKISVVPVSLFIIEIISHAIMYLQVNLDEKKLLPEISTLTFLANPAKISIVLWMTKNCLLLCFLCYAIGQFYHRVQRAQEICCSAMKFHSHDSLRRLGKNVERCTGARFSRLYVCGVPVDAGLPLGLAGVATSYIVVVLQLNLS